MSALDRNIQSGYKVLANLQAVDGLTDAGAAWLVNVCDPSHDYPTRTTGIPDHCQARTYCRKVRTTQPISKGTIATLSSTGFDPAATWQFQVATHPTFFALSLSRCNWYRSGDFDFKQYGVADTSTTTIAPITLDYRDDTAASKAVYPTISAPDPLFTVNTATEGIISIAIPGLLPDNNKYRMIGVSYHVINTTPIQYMGGTCTVYRPSLELDNRIRQVWGHSANLDIFNGMWAAGNAGYTQTIPIQARMVQLPMGDLATIRDLPTFQQWSAHEGAYVVAAIDPDEIIDWTEEADSEIPIAISFEPAPVTAPLYRTAFSYKDNVIGGIYYDGALYSTNIPRNASGLLTWGTPNAWLNAVETTCARFTELPKESTFMLNITWMYEVLPDLSDGNFTVAEMSAAYDPVALGYQARITRYFPAGTLVRFNPLGEWFARIMGVLGKVAGPIGEVLGSAGIPFAGVVGHAIGNGANAILSYMNKPGKAV